MRRYRRTCLDAYLVRRERSLGYVNNGGMPGNVWTGFGPLIMSEGWSEYAVGALQVTGAANWTATAGTGHGTAQTDGTSIVKAIKAAPAGAQTESIVFNNLSGVNVKWNQALRWIFQLSSLAANDNITFQLGANSMNYQSGQVTVAGTVFAVAADALLHTFDIQMQAGTNRVARVLYDGTFLGNSAAFNPSVGAGAVISYGNFFTWNAVNPCYTIGTVKFYATHS